MDALAFLSDPWFVVPWYAFGAVAAAWIYRDLHSVNTPLKKAIKWGWPIVAFFFSAVGLALYFLTARPPGIDDALSYDEKMKLQADYERAMWRRVNGAVIHCVAGDGLGIMTAMVIARLLEVTFWQEFWFEYAVGFAFGWLIFQLKAMRMTTDSTAMALWMAFRAEFFSMLTVMGGMGAVMAYVTPMVVGVQPKPETAAFWGFGMFGLMLGYVFTRPMNWMLVKIGWKHGMGPDEDARPVRTSGSKVALGAAMAALGAVALAIPAALAAQRETKQALMLSMAATSGGLGASTLAGGLRRNAQVASQALASGDRMLAAASLDGAMRLAEVARAAGAPAAEESLRQVKLARRELQEHQLASARAALEPELVLPDAGKMASDSSQARQYGEVPLLNLTGAVIGEVKAGPRPGVALALGGAHDILGFWDPAPRQHLSVSPDQLVFGPRRMVGKSFVMLKTDQIAPVERTAISSR